MPEEVASLEEALRLERPEKAVGEIVEGIRREVEAFRRRGAVVGLSGGVDSSVVASLAVRALGPERVLGVMMPEAESSSEGLELGRLVAARLGIETVLEDITPVLEAAGCYRHRDEAIARVIPEYGPGWKAKLVLPSLLASSQYRLSSVFVRGPAGEEKSARLPPSEYLQVVAATSFKQRVRKMMEYFHADRKHYVVLGTPNRLEYDQGFFVKNGDGSADVKPIAHLYKSQVYQLASVLDVPEAVVNAGPTTDTYALPQTQSEFFFSVPYQTLDVCLYAVDHGVPAAEVARQLGLEHEQVERVFADIASKRRVAEYLHAAPRLLGAG